MNDKVFAALGNEIRLTIIQMLLIGEMTVSEIVPFVHIAQPSVSRHMDILKEAGLVKSRKDGTKVYYSVIPGALWDTGLYLMNLLKDKMMCEQ